MFVNSAHQSVHIEGQLLRLCRMMQNAGTQEPVGISPRPGPPQYFVRSVALSQPGADHAHDIKQGVLALCEFHNCKFHYCNFSKLFIYIWLMRFWLILFHQYNFLTILDPKIAVIKEIAKKKRISQIAVMKKKISQKLHQPNICLMRNLANATFSQAQKLHQARTLCTIHIFDKVDSSLSMKQATFMSGISSLSKF